MESSGSTAGQGAKFGRELSAAVVFFHEAVGRHLGLSPTDQRALTLIDLHGPMTAGELSQLTGITPGAVTGLVDRLERAGHVSRQNDPRDRRRAVIAATHEAPEAVSAAFAELGGKMAAVVAGYDEREQAAIADFVQHMIDVLREQTRRLSDTR
ncbi:MarR family winged helix-turn-helix transcriptional regulator [Actinomadura rugatobispora]|uniref:MarR family winged helix-turn-helix transcriptional regulator n=1 Tax=Actinomadura rugatobispora TaxID=1994 RepID=A0ABW0ZUU3_9ACTN|nr:MarR family transcriptional regulator [Actinomadura rugatobispora]